MHSLLLALQQRLHASLGRSPLLRLHPSQQLIDCTSLDQIDAQQSRNLLAALLENNPAQVQCYVQSGADGDNSLLAQQQNLYETLSRKIRNSAQLIQRDSGVHALWLAYPLLAVPAPPGSQEKALLAPLLLWPLKLSPNPAKQGQLKIELAPSLGELRPNAALWAWLHRHWQLSPPLPDEELLSKPTLNGLQNWLNRLAEAFIYLEQPVDLLDLQALPKQAASDNAQIIAAAALGCIQWPHAAILDDLETLSSSTELADSALRNLSSSPANSITHAPHEIDRHLVQAADFSQAQAIWQARNSAGLFIHGPPGTGKSQTIVNIIADSLARGERVLMVCQKQAALRVVEKGLQSVGLDSLSLLVQDAEADRQAVFRLIRNQTEQLPAQIDVQPLQQKTALRRSLADDIEQLSQALDEHARALHQRLREDWPPYVELCAEVQQLQQQISSPANPALLRELSNASSAQVQAWCEQLQQLGSQHQRIDWAQNPWTQRKPGAYSAARQQQIAEFFKQILAADAAHQEYIAANRQAAPPELLQQSVLCGQLREAVDLVEHDAGADVQHWLQVLRELNAWAVAAIQAQVQRLSELTPPPPTPASSQDWARQCASLSLTELQQLRESCAYLQRQHGRWWHYLMPAYYQARARLQRVFPQSADDETLLLWAAELEQFLQVQAQQAEWQLAWQRSIPGHPYWQPPADTVAHCQRWQNSLQLASALQQAAQAQPWLRAYLDDLIQGETEHLKQALDRSQARQQPLEKLQSLLQALSDALPDDCLQNWQQAIADGRSIAEDMQPWQQGLSQLSAIQDWEQQHQHLSRQLRRIYQHILSYELDELPAAEAWPQLLRWHALRAWMQVYEAHYPGLKSFSTQQHQDKVQRLRQALHSKQALESRQILSRWQQRQLPWRGAPWKRWFQLRSSHLNKAKRLREAVELSLPSGLLDLRPCWLLNPETVARIFPLQAGLFDLVIFDEASQCLLEEALPALFRAKRLVVCGDEKQLPPTQFFSTQQAAPLGVELSPAAQALWQADDLLQALSGKLPEAWLQVHYRSQHPALIEFSNRAFYHGLLHSPPAQVSALAQRPIEFHAVAGVYQQRRNLIEAQHVVALLRQLWLQADPPSVGIISFNQVQRDCIEECLEQSCAMDAELAAAYQHSLSASNEQALFIKNLENVQGDEREVIIFSTTFGADENGNFARRFGPLGTQGGERRLNVAITRARQRLIIVSSLPLHDFGPQPGQAPQQAADYFALYLRYAQAISNGDKQQARAILDGFASLQTEQKQAEQPPALAARIQQQLQQAGFSAHYQARDALHPRLWIEKTGLAIDLDGPLWQSAWDARQREVWREDLLAQRGWQVQTLWTQAPLDEIQLRALCLPSTKIPEIASI